MKEKEDLEVMTDEQFVEWFTNYSVLIHDDDLFDWCIQRLKEIAEKNED